eukprot:scaffold278378_cov35-Tisochrysis_lutea.AAC.2
MVGGRVGGGKQCTAATEPRLLLNCAPEQRCTHLIWAVAARLPAVEYASSMRSGAAHEADPAAATLGPQGGKVASKGGRCTAMRIDARRWRSGRRFVEKCEGVVGLYSYSTRTLL